ncbi:MAG: N-methyl-L-tryptophan oxidase [Balneolaceae bacterium]|nr:N-methyl-L-tryptophan oxidase [Balneolaceae bacterium]MBO6546424.1 N-methyl-L-tryptophan oxidase [Balneolaceae bacterium]MBO6648783.1 N-methyl-L-tryptophan oxidase [Balneolaceae bacterium]
MYNTIIIGLGSMGSSALYQLAKRGIKALGLEQFGIGHTKGSHSGQTRIVRKAYFEHPDYVPLLEEAYKGWDSIQRETGKQLFHKNGLVYFGEPGHKVMEGVEFSANTFNIRLARMINEQLKMFEIPSHFQALIEPEAGFAVAEETIRSFIGQAEKLGAEVQTRETVMGWRLKDNYVEVHTDKMEYHTEKLILTAGAYTNQLIHGFSNQLTVTRQLIFWIKPEHPDQFAPERFPCWVVAEPEYPGIFYGFPILSAEQGGNGLLKIAHHAPGEFIHPKDLNKLNPEKEKEKLRSFLKKYLPEIGGDIVEVTACLYTYSPDEHFIIDFLPDTNSRVVLAAGFSGHGFKFVPVVGEILADLALQGKTELPIDFLRLNRF